MDFRQIILISLQITNVISKKYASSSDESIENLLYFKDCQHKKKEEQTPSPPIERLSAPIQPKPMECPFPKMCCAMTCGDNECSSGPQSSSFMGRQEQNPMENNFPPIRPLNGPPLPKQPQQQSMPRGRKKKGKQPMRLPLQPPIGGRRGFGFTKDRIKSLINQDDDIRKILKDLVRVTMQKADLVDMMNSKKVDVKPEMAGNIAPDDDDDDDDLE